MQTFSEQLRAGCEADWRAATEHRFVTELANDSISDADYARYLILDYAFLDILVAHVGRAVTTAPGMIEKRPYAGFLGVLTGDEDDYFLRSFAAMGVSEDDWRQPFDHAVVRGFREIMLGAPNATYAEVLAALLPVEWVYLTWAKSVADHAPARFYLKEWIDLHTDPGFEEFVMWMAAEMDRIGPALSDVERTSVKNIFDRAVELEVAFFDAAYET
ncbi:MAG: TenA family protein [Alphaproteobacteria bacterium]|jgi:thiaminase/transcriptional activator TenA|nr:TenA family protein [Alphaproteobacteria bacterium]MDP6832117.1 TenA family protein [Alphaproteobacteria bacterium]